MRDLLLDVNYALRTSRKSPWMSLLVAGSLAIGIAANTTVFSFVNAIQFKPLPFTDEDTLVDVSESSPTRLCAGCAVGTSYPGFLDWRARAQSFQAMGAYREERFVVAGGSAPERLSGALISSNLFNLLGVQPALGRSFVDTDDRPAGDPVVILGETLWRRHFAGRQDILGQTLRVNGIQRTIVGVMPERFAFPEYAQLWIPLAQGIAPSNREDRSLGIVARLREGVTVDAARVEMRTIAATHALENPASNQGWSAAVVSLREDMTSETAMASMVLLGAVGFVLLIACANVANLLLVRATDRSREVAIRVALGASPRRIVRLVLAESLAFAVAGGVLGLLISLWTSQLLVARFTVDVPYWIRFGLDWKVFSFCAALTAAVAVLCGLPPAAQSVRPDVRGALAQGVTASAKPAARRLRSVLAAGQLALALVLLAGAGLLIKTVLRTFSVELRYDASRVLVGDLHLQGVRYEPSSAAMAFAVRLLEGLRRVPGTRAAISQTVFFGGFGSTPRQIELEGAPTPPGASPSFYHAVTADYFPIHGIAAREGRLFTDREAAVVVINQEMARRTWGAGRVLNERIKFGDEASAATWFTVIGVVDDSGSGMFGMRAQPTAYVPLAAAPGRDLALHVSSVAGVSTAAADIRREVAGIDPDQPIENLMTMEEALAVWAAPARFVALLMSSLSVIALVLAALGTYGVIAYGVSQRSREIGIRMALGATPRQIQALIARSGARLIAAGAVTGLLGAWAFTRSLQGILAGTSPTDPAVFAMVTIALAIVGLLAAWVPAKRAAKVDPLEVLRSL
jgi:predicted permease